MSAPRRGPRRRTSRARPEPFVLGPELSVIVGGNELLERAHTVGTRIGERVRQLVGPSGSRPASAAALAAGLLGRLMRGRP